MKTFTTALLAAAALSLAACGGSGDDALAENAQEGLQNQADSMEAMADNTSGAASEQMEQQAENLSEKAEGVEEAVDNTDVNADDLSPAQQNAVVNQVTNQM